jgi:hypothetical protein
MGLVRHSTSQRKLCKVADSSITTLLAWDSILKSRLLNLGQSCFLVPTPIFAVPRSIAPTCTLVGIARRRRGRLMPEQPADLVQRDALPDRDARERMPEVMKACC